MKKLITAILCFAATTSFAQNGFFLQPEIGGGLGNSSFGGPQWVSYQKQGIFSYQGQIDIGYNSGKWQFITGAGYLRTGITVKNAGPATFMNAYGLTEPMFFIDRKLTDYNPHIIVPVKAGYEVLRFSDKFSFIPFIGAEYAFNMRRTFIYPSETITESKGDFNRSCNSTGIIGLLDLNFAYKLNKHIDLTGGPSANYMFTSMLNFRQQNDYAILFNLGMKYNFKKRTATKM